MITIDYGIKVLEPIEYILTRVPGKRTLFNWFPKDEGRLESPYCVLSGIDYDDMLAYAHMAGMKVIIKC